VAQQHAHSAYHHPVPEPLAQEKPHSISFHFRLREKEVMHIVDPIFF